jgi:rhodanese-related sulfurtransferase
LSELPYAGDRTPQEAWSAFASTPGAILVDVRTTAEWAYVGSPDVSGTGALLLRVEWQTYPSMQVNPAFLQTLDQAVRAAGGDVDTPLYFICRSGARSAAAAAAMTESGFAHCFNVAGGFEGRRDAEGHRGTIEGWKADGLPWVQA